MGGVRERFDRLTVNGELGWVACVGGSTGSPRTGNGAHGVRGRFDRLAANGRLGAHDVRERFDKLIANGGGGQVNA
jgi:hypothetical protein